MYFPSNQVWNGLGRGHYLSQTRINTGSQNAPTIQVIPWTILLKSGLEPLTRYGTHQETISGRPEQKYLPSDQRLEWPAEGPLF